MSRWQDAPDADARMADLRARLARAEGALEKALEAASLALSLQEQKRAIRLYHEARAYKGQDDE